jgi:hypothetical protein
LIKSNNWLYLIKNPRIFGGIGPSVSPWNTFLFWYSLCLLIMLLPFMFADLDYADNAHACVNQAPMDTMASNWWLCHSWVYCYFLIFGILTWCCLSSTYLCRWTMGAWYFIDVMEIILVYCWICYILERIKWTVSRTNQELYVDKFNHWIYLVLHWTYSNLYLSKIYVCSFLYPPVCIPTGMTGPQIWFSVTDIDLQVFFYDDNC